jgi:small-conductance mechanosensitive channel
MSFETTLAWMGSLSPYAAKIGTSLAIVLLAYIAVRLTGRLLLKRVAEPEPRFRVRRMVVYLAWAISAFFLGLVWFEGFRDASTFLGLLSAGLAVALQRPITNIAGFFFIMWHRPFRVGDRIQIAAVRGDVIDVGLFQTTLLEIGNWVDADQSTGRIISMPNYRVFEEHQANYNAVFELIWHEISVVVTFDSDWKRAKSLIEETAVAEYEQIRAGAEETLKRAEAEHIIQYRNITPRVYTSVIDRGVRLTLRYLCSPRQRRDTEERVWEAILTAFGGRDDIRFSIPDGAG